MLNIIKVIKFIILVVPGFTIFQDCIAQNRHIYADVGIHNAALLSFESMRRRIIPDTISSVYYKNRISYHARIGLQTGRMDYGLIFKALSFADVNRYYIRHFINFKEHSGSGTFYSLAPRFGYTFLKKNKTCLQSFIEFGIPLATRIDPIKMVYSNDSVSYNNSTFFYAFDFRTGFVLNRKISNNLDLTFSGYYLYMAHGNSDDEQNVKTEQLWGVRGGYLGGNVGVRYNIKMRKEK